MNQQWYYGTKDNQQCGPVDREVILEKLRNNELTRDSLLWREGMAQWQRMWTLMAELEAPASSSVNNTPVTPVTTQTHQYTSSVSGSAATSKHIESGSHNENKSTASPYTAPASGLAGDAVVQGGEIIYAGFWRRAAACLVDSTLVGVAGQVIGGIIGAAGAIITTAKSSLNAQPAIGEALIFLLSFLAGLLIGIAYYAYFHSSNNAATPGKMLVGIKVVRPDGERITFLRGIGRFFATYISSMIMCIGYIMAAFTERKQALHDIMCDTWVVDKWAFTDRPQLQQRGLGTATIVILSIFAVLLVITIIAIIIATFAIFAAYNGK